MLGRRVLLPLLRFGFRLFYNEFAFSYDAVSALVSHGRWRAWTDTAIPRIAGSRVLELPCGTGNLLLDMLSAGHRPIGADLSPAMLGISRRKLQRSQQWTPLVRMRAQQLGFATGIFDSVVMTFPPSFVSDPAAFAEVRRVMSDHGRLIWVDSARFVRPGIWSRLVNRWIGFTGGTADYEGLMRQVLAQAGLDSTIEWVRDDSSEVVIAIGTRSGAAQAV